MAYCLPHQILAQYLRSKRSLCISGPVSITPSQKAKVTRYEDNLTLPQNVERGLRDRAITLPDHTWNSPIVLQLDRDLTRSGERMRCGLAQACAMLVREQNHIGVTRRQRRGCLGIQSRLCVWELWHKSVQNEIRKQHIFLSNNHQSILHIQNSYPTGLNIVPFASHVLYSLLTRLALRQSPVIPYTLRRNP